MVDPVVEKLILELLEWVARRERTYEDVIDAWRTSCPRLPIWEDANERGFLVVEQAKGRRIVTITAAGLGFLQRHKPSEKSIHWNNS
ncbi:MAG TPA: hypothetical protein VNX88_06680 [Terriglobales bacterium]|jgi:hypothetical protein|nr:hypothetical protein [Terriglobales bacterium]